MSFFVYIGALPKELDVPTPNSESGPFKVEMSVVALLIPGIEAKI